MSRLSARRSHVVGDRKRRRGLPRCRCTQDQRVLQAIYSISLACRERSNLRAILETINRALAQIFNFDAAYIALCNDTSDTFGAALLIDENYIEYVENRRYGFLTGTIVRQRLPLLYHDLTKEVDQHAPLMVFGNLQRRSRSWLGVPLMVGDMVIGVISIQSYRPGIYTQSTETILQHIANVIAVAVENVYLIEQHGQLSRALRAQVSARTGELTALSRIAAIAITRRPLAEMLVEALDVALALFHFDAGNVRLIDDTHKYLLLHAHRGFSERYVQAALRTPIITNPLRDVVLTATVQVIERGWHNTFQSHYLLSHAIPPFESALNLPISSGSGVIGTLTLLGLHEQTLNTHTIDLAQAVANQIAILIENTRLLEERERQISELHALSSVSRAASTAQDLRTLLRQVYTALREFLPLDAFSMLMYDPDLHVVSDGLVIDQYNVSTYWSNQPLPPRSLSAWIIRTGFHLRFEHLPTPFAIHEPISYREGVDGERHHVHSWLGVPMYDRTDRVIGVISVQGYAPCLFGSRDEHLLHSIAAQLALHVQNVRLLTQRARQIAELEAIGQIGKLVTASYNLNQMLDEVRRVVVGLTAAPVFYLLVCEPVSHLITHAIFVQEGIHLPLDILGMKVQSQTMSGWIITHREALLYQDLIAQHADLVQRGIAPQTIVQEEVRSWAGVPLVARDGELIGVLSVQDYRSAIYDIGTIHFLEQVGSSVSLGVQKMRLFDATQAQAVENARLAQEFRAAAAAAERQATRIGLVQRIASILSTRLNLEEVLDIASRELMQLFWADHSGTVLIRSDGMGYIAAEYPATGILGVTLDLHDNPLIDAFNGERSPILIADIETDPRAATNRENWRAMGISSLVIIPLISRDQVFGSISLDSYQHPFTFNEEEIDLMMTVATSIATAVENAQLFAAEQEQRRTADTLREMARVLSSSFNPNEVLRLILAELHKVIAFDTASIMLLDGENLRMVASRGRPGGDDVRGVSLPIEGTGAGEVVRRQEPILWVAGRSDGAWARIPTAANIRAWIGAPLIARGNLLGILNIDLRTESDHIFAERDIEVARTFANHAAVALENAQLYEASITRIEQELEIARRIQANLFPRQLPQIQGLAMAARCIPARETGGDFYDVIDMGSRIGIIVGDVAGKSLAAAMLMAVARSTARSEARNHETPWVVLTETNRWLVDDVPNNAFVALNYALVDPQQRRLILAGAGQLSPLLCRADGSTSFIHVPSSLPLGLINDTTYEQIELDLLPGDTLVFYTDGIVEAHDQNRALFGFERFEACCARWAHLSPDEIIARIILEVNLFAEGTPTHDDMTLLIVQMN